MACKNAALAVALAVLSGVAPGFKRFVPAPPTHSVKSMYAPRADPPCSKNLILF